MWIYVYQTKKMIEELAKNIVRKKRKMSITEAKSLECLKQDFYRSFLSFGKLKVYEHNVKLYEKNGIDTGEHRRNIRYYKNKYRSGRFDGNGMYC
jgi:hypothetical protein